MILICCSTKSVSEPMWERHLAAQKKMKLRLSSFETACADIEQMNSDRALESMKGAYTLKTGLRNGTKPFLSNG